MRAPMRVTPATANPSREWGSPEGANRRFGPFGATLLVLFCSRQKRTLLHRRWPPRRAPAKAKELFYKKTFLPNVRRVHFSTVGGLHGESPPRPKNSFLKKRFPPTFRRALSRPQNSLRIRTYAIRPTPPKNLDKTPNLLYNINICVNNKFSASLRRKKWNRKNRQS